MTKLSPPLSRSGEEGIRQIIVLVLLFLDVQGSSLPPTSLQFRPNRLALALVPVFLTNGFRVVLGLPLAASPNTASDSPSGHNSPDSERPLPRIRRAICPAREEEG